MASSLKTRYISCVFIFFHSTADVLTEGYPSYFVLLKGTAATEACKELELSLVQKTLQMVLCELSSSFFCLLVDFLSDRITASLI